MPLGIPMPGIDRSGLFEGLVQGNQAQHARKQLEQQWQQHLHNLEIQRQQQARLAEEHAMNQELHPYKLQAAQQGALNSVNQAPLSLDLLKAKIDAEKARAEKARREPSAKQVDEVRQQRTQQLINAYNWSQMPADAKNNVIAMGNSLGIRPDVLVQGMTSGKSFDQIAAEHSHQKEDVNNTEPKYLPTSSNVTAENKKQKYLAELDSLEQNVSNAMAPYIQTMGGYSPKQIIDAFSGKNPDQLAAYLAARALQPEISSLRIKAQEGNLGEGAIHGMVESSLGHSKILQSQVTPEVYNKMNHYMNQWLKDAAKAATSSLYSKGGNQKAEQKPRKRFNPVTGMVEQ